MRKKFALIIAFVLICKIGSAKDLYIDYNLGLDSNVGTIDKPLKTINEALKRIDFKSSESVRLILLPGIYYIDETIMIKPEGQFTNTNRLSIEALYLPDDEKWKPGLMPILLTAAKSDTAFDFVNCVGLKIEMSHVSLKGLKFTGQPYPQMYCFPIARDNPKFVDLEISQCMFVGNNDASSIQVGIIVHGSKTVIDHCIFYGCNNAVVFFLSNNGEKKNNEIKNTIIYNSNQAVWVSDADSGFVFDHNIITKCRHAFVKNHYNETIYSLSSSIITDNQNYLTTSDASGKLVSDSYKINEDNLIKEGNISLVQVAVGENFDKRYLHPINGTLGSGLGAGLFKNRK